MTERYGFPTTRMIMKNFCENMKNAELKRFTTNELSDELCKREMVKSLIAPDDTWEVNCSISKPMDNYVAYENIQIRGPCKVIVIEDDKL